MPSVIVRSAVVMALLWWACAAGAAGTAAPPGQPDNQEPSNMMVGQEEDAGFTKWLDKQSLKALQAPTAEVAKRITARRSQVDAAIAVAQTQARELARAEELVRRMQALRPHLSAEIWPPDSICAPCGEFRRSAEQAIWPSSRPSEKAETLGLVALQEAAQRARGDFDAACAGLDAALRKADPSIFADVRYFTLSNAYAEVMIGLRHAVQACRP